MNMLGTTSRSLTAGTLLTAMAGAVALLAGCPGAFPPPPALDPFVDLDPIPRDGRAQAMSSGLASLGFLEADTVLGITVTGQNIDTVLLLTEDALIPQAGVIAGSGLPNSPFRYRVLVPGTYVVLALFESGIDPAGQQATIEVSAGDPAFQPAAERVVLVTFESGFLTNPGLFDPESGTPEQRTFLESLEPIVEAGVVDLMRSLYADFPVRILTTDDALPAGAVSSLTFTGRRVEAAQAPDAEDLILPVTPDPRCNQGVVFGEVLGEGFSSQDPVNAMSNAEAVVYVGSFQGRGEACQSAVVNSINNVINALAYTGAHEIGHLIGLFHVAALDDIMVISPNLAFQRELRFTRGQLLLGSDTPTAALAAVLSNVIQDPALYVRANFQP